MTPATGLSRTYRAYGKLVPVAVIFSTTLVTLAALNPERLVASGFETALSASASQFAHTVPRVTDRVAAAEDTVTLVKSVPIAGSEAYWLKAGDRTAHASAHVKPVTWSPPVSRGDRFTMSSGSNKQTMEVVSVRELDGLSAVSSGQEAETLAKGPQWLISCRDANNPAAQPIHLIVDAATPLPWTVRTRDHSL